MFLLFLILNFRWYVYAYIQPRQNPRKRTLEQFIKKDVFYVGKGTKNRSRDHLLKAMRVSTELPNLKFNRHNAALFLLQTEICYPF